MVMVNRYFSHHLFTIQYLEEVYSLVLARRLRKHPPYGSHFSIALDKELTLRRCSVFKDFTICN